MTIPFGSYAVDETPLTTPGKAIQIGSVIYMHRLDIISMTASGPLSRLDEAMAWLLSEAHAKLDRVAAKL